MIAFADVTVKSPPDRITLIRRDRERDRSRDPYRMLPILEAGGRIRNASGATAVPRPPRPATPKADNIPDELTARPQWVLWKFEWRVDYRGVGKWTKVPFQSGSSSMRASPTDPRTWHPFHHVWMWYEAGQDS